MKKIMVLTSNYTGHGHKSISDALAEQFAKHEDVEIETVEAFQLIGDAGVTMSKLYGPMTRGSKSLWKGLYDMANRSDKLVTETLATLIHDRFLNKLAASRPDAIVTVHPMFNGSVLNLLEQYRIDIPVISMQADIISIHKTWCDPRSSVTMCPTQEAYEASLRMGMPPEKLHLCGFPTRAQFCEAARAYEKRDYDGTRPLECLMMSGGEGSGNMRRYAVEMLNHFNCHLTVICGRNAHLKKSLGEALRAKYGERATVLGFVNNVQDYMLESDLVIARGSPNSLMEAVICMTPLVITGALPGQEAGNPSMMAKHRLGVLCAAPEQVGGVVGALTANGGEKLREIREAQRAYRNFDNAKDIVEYICSITEHKEREIPAYKRNLPVTMRPRYVKGMTKLMLTRMREK